MPLLKRKPYVLSEPPTDLKPRQHVYQIRFTREIFRDYDEYLTKINLYRQRVWTCKVTAKTNLTYEEALVSELNATEKIQKFPYELIPSVLQTVQFSMLSLKDLVNTITVKLQYHLLVGEELYGKRDDCVSLCQIIKVLEEGDNKTRYEVAWLDKDKKRIGTAVVNAEDLIRKKLPFTREVLKSFIRESTYRNVPWVLHDKWAQEHAISTDPPEEIRSKYFFKDGHLVINKKKRKTEDDKQNTTETRNGQVGKSKNKLEREKSEGLVMERSAEKEDFEPKEEPINYPIDDLLVRPGPDDPVFTDRPSPSRDFTVPMDCVGDLLMVWDFVSSFGRLLHLFPFSLQDFENAICHKDSNLIIIVETHSALLRLLVKDDGQYFTAIQEKKRKPKITIITWTEYLCDFLEMVEMPELSSCIPTIKRGHYGLLETHAKLGIFRELIAQTLATDLVRKKLDEYIEERQTLAATKRGEAIEEGRKKREEKERLKAESAAVQEANGHGLENNNTSDDALGNSDGKKSSKKQKVDVKDQPESGKDPSKKEANKMTLQQPKADKKETTEKKSIEQRREYLQREIDKRFIRTEPLGKDKDYNRYWFFRRDGRIFVESWDSKQWGYYSTKEELDAFKGSLNRKGVRERALQSQLEKSYNKICFELQKRSKDVAQKIAMEEAVLRRSTRVRAPPRDNPAVAFLKYVNKWKED